MNKEDRSVMARNLHRSGCNCCQSVLLAFADKLPIDEVSAKNLSAPFGSGIAGCREVCGCVSAMAMACGLTGHVGDVRNLIEKFREENGDIVCARLLKAGKKPCGEMVAYTAGLLDEVV